MLPEEFRRFGHEVVDWIAGYLENPVRYPVFPKVSPGDVIDALPPHGPEKGEPMERILADFRELIVPAMTHWNHPGFMAYFANTSPGPGILGEMLAATLNGNGMLWKTSPAVTELEQVTLGWLREWMGLPDGWFGMIHDTASTSTMHALIAAREAADPDVRSYGEYGASKNLIVYRSEQSHSSVEKDAIAIGIGQENVRRIPVDAEFRMRADALEQAVRKDCDESREPMCVVATVGTTSTTSVDPVPAIADIAKRYRMWLHVDAAYAGSAMICPEFRWAFAGCERADSLLMNPHKWLFTPMDLSAFYTRRPEVLRQALSLVPEYLRTDDGSRAVNMMDYSVPLGRRFRALKLWFILRYYGREALADIIRAHVAWAQELAAMVDADPDFERSAPTPFSTVCFRYRGSDEQNLQILEKVNASGEVFLSHTVLCGRTVLHLAIGNMGTTRAHVMRAWELIKSNTSSVS
jgi:aromatic-L-amino-acid decarboxylase